jgi:NitT/TauT family transport system substrate-binding protein
MKRLIAAIAAAALLALAGGAAAQTPTKIKVGYTNTAAFAGLFIAKEEGLFAKRGLDVDLVLIALNSTIPAALQGDSIQIGGPTPSVLLQAVEGGLDVVTIAGCSVNDASQKEGGGVVARTGVDIKAAKDFEGKRVGVPGLGAYMHVLFRRWLVDKGADDKKVNFVEVPFAQGSDILKAGNVDALLTGDPFYSRIVQSKTGYLVSPYLSEMPDNLFSVYFASTRAWSEKNGAAIKAFREALAEGNEFLQKNPARAREIVGKTMKLPPDVVASIALPKLKIDVPASDVKYWIETLADQGVTKTRPDATKLVVSPGA